jgi:methylated-DNA-[protein]-cysteine S-methyltransferase
MLARATDEAIVMLRSPINAGDALAGTSQGARKLLEQLREQLAQYFAGERRVFTLPISQPGTPFQRRVWNELLNIPFGETISYATLARRVGAPHAARAVGGANAANALAILVPCHRVIGKNGSLAGFAGGVGMKRALLALETAGLFTEEKTAALARDGW